MSALENKLMDNVFRAAQTSGQPGALNAAGTAGTAETMARYAFKDFVHYFMMLEEQAKASARQSTPQSGGSSLMSGALQLDIRVKRYEVEAPTAGQPVTVRQHETGQAGARQIEIHGTEAREDGTLVNTVTVIELAVAQHQVQGPNQAKASGQTGQLKLAEASGTAGDTLASFFARSPYAGAAGTTLWQYSSEDAMELVEEEARIDSFSADQAMQQLVEAAYKVLKYMQLVELNTEFRMTNDEVKLIQEALNSSPDSVVFKSVMQLLKKKKIKVVKVKQELKKQQEELEQKLKGLESENMKQLAELEKDGQKAAPATNERSEEISKISKQIKQIKKMLTAIQAFEYVADEKQASLDPDGFKLMLEEFNKVNLSMAMGS